MIKLDVHQHLWTEPLLTALSKRSELPFVRNEGGLTMLFLAGERPYVIETSSEDPARRGALLALDELDAALVCLSSPLGIESLPRDQALPLIEAYHDGALALGPPFGVWGAIPLERAGAADVDRVLDDGCVGLALPAGALAGADALARLAPVLARLESRDAPLFVHPGGDPRAATADQVSLRDPLWWPALTRYVAQVQAAWLAFIDAGRTAHPDLRVIFSMLGGLAPLHTERLRSRGGPEPCLADAQLFYETSSYGPLAVRTLAAALGGSQILFGSDRPVVEPAELGMPDELDWDPVLDATARAFPGLTATARQPALSR